MVASSYSCNPSEEKMDDEAAPLLRFKHESSQPSSSSSSSPWSFFPDEGNNVVKSIIPVKVMVLLTILSGLLVFIACCDHMDMNGSMSMGGHVNKDHTSPTMVNDISSADSTISGTNVNNNGDSSDSSSSFGETLENMFTSLVHDIEQPGDIKGFAPDIMKMLENNYTNDIDYGYGAYNFMARDAEDFPPFVDSEGYIYRVWPFENIVRYVPGGTRTMELAKVIGKFHHLAPDGNIILLNGSFCPQINGEMSATMVVKCATEKKLDMIETSACKYLFTAYHPTVCTPQPTEAPIIAPTGTPTHVPTMYSSAPTIEPTMMPAYPTINPTVKTTDSPTQAPVMPRGGKSHPEDYGHLSYLIDVELPTHLDRIQGFTYEIQPFNQVIRYTVDEHEQHHNESLIGIFDGLDEDGRIIIRDGVLCDDVGDKHLGGTLSVTCGSDNVFELNKLDACTYEMNLFTDQECTGTPTSTPTSRPTQRPNVMSSAPTYQSAPTNNVDDDAFGSFIETMMPTSEATIDPDAPTVYINNPRTFWPTGGLLPCDQVDVDNEADDEAVANMGPTLNGEPVGQITPSGDVMNEMSIQKLYELNRKVEHVDLSLSGMKSNKSKR